MDSPVPSYQYFGFTPGGPTLDAGLSEVETSSIAAFLEEIFSDDSGYCILHWNGVFVPMSFKYDISVCFEDWVEILRHLSAPSDEPLRVAFPSNTFRVDWVLRVEQAGEVVVIDADWHTVLGGVEQALRRVSPVRYPASMVESEVRKLLRVVVEVALGVSGVEHVEGFDDVIAVIRQ